MKAAFNIISFLLFSVLFSACLLTKSTADSGSSSKRKPEWVEQRPTNTQYYIGVGYASKLSNSGDYQRVAKKNALDDLIGEVKVTVSSNSVLSQYQNNQNFNQQYISDTRLNATETLEGYQVVDSWENKTEYWIYYRLNKADFEAYKRKKLYEATEKALDYMYRADKTDLKTDFLKMLKLRISAAAALQNYLNESIETEYHGKNVFLMNELLSQIQDQLYMMQLSVNPQQMQIVTGKSLEYPISAKVMLKTKDSILWPVAYLPLKISGSNIQFKGNPLTETQPDGSAGFAISAIRSKETLQVLQVKTAMEQLLRTDSINTSLRKILMNLEGPAANIRLKIEPIKLYMQAEELNMGSKMNYPILEPALKMKLIEKGCTFVSSKDQADYVVQLKASTKDQGVMWGNMLRATADVSISISEQKSGNEILRDGLEGVQGFQTTLEKAGIEAYRNLSTDMINKLLPKITDQLISD